jgi:hypothetical protein
MFNLIGLLIWLIGLMLPAVVISNLVVYSIKTIKEGLNQEPVNAKSIGVSICLLIGCCGVVILASQSNENLGRIVAFFMWVAAIPTGFIAAFRLEKPVTNKKATFLIRLFLALVLPGAFILNDFFTNFVMYETSVQNSVLDAEEYIKTYYRANNTFPSAEQVMRKHITPTTSYAMLLTKETNIGWVYDSKEPSFTVGYMYKNKLLWFVSFRRLCLYNSIDDYITCELFLGTG